MNDPAKDPSGPRSSQALAGGFFICIGLLGGAVIGLINGQPSMGMVGGFAVGVLLALVLWLFDRRGR